MKTPSDLLTLRLTLSVTYQPNGTPAAELREMLRDIANHASGSGLMTGETAAEVDTWNADVEEVGTNIAPAATLANVREWLLGDLEAAEVARMPYTTVDVDTLRARLDALDETPAASSPTVIDLLGRALEYVERYAEQNDEPKGGDCWTLAHSIRNALQAATLAQGEELTPGEAAGLRAILDQAVDVLKEATVPGGIGPHEFARPGGWLERARAAIEAAKSTQR